MSFSAWLGYLGNTVMSQGEVEVTQIPVRVHWGNQEPFSLFLELCPACSLEFSPHSSCSWYPKQPIDQDSPTAQPPAAHTAGKEMLPTRKYNLVGKTIISLKESAAILPLQVPITFHWFNNKKTQRELIPLGLWVGRWE